MNKEIENILFELVEIFLHDINIFFSVFSTKMEYSVRDGSQEIGSVQTPYIIGQLFSLAGFTWKVLDINEEKRQIFVKKVGGIPIFIEVKSERNKEDLENLLEKIKIKKLINGSLKFQMLLKKMVNII